MTEVRSITDFMKESEGVCYGYASRVVYEEKGQMRSGVEFEVIQSQKIAAFLKRDRSLALKYQDKTCVDLLERYLEYGSEDEAFYQKKLAYFGDSTTVFYFTIWFNAPAEAEQIVLTKWYLIEDEGRFQYQVVPFMYDEIVKAGTCNIYNVKQPDQDTLNTLLKEH